MLRVRISSPAFVFHHRPFRCIIAALIVLGMHVCGCCAVYGHGCFADADEHCGQSADPVAASDQDLWDVSYVESHDNAIALTSLPANGGVPCTCSGDRWPMTVESSRTAVPAPDLVPAADVLDILPPRVIFRHAFAAGGDSPRPTSSLLRLHCALLI